MDTIHGFVALVHPLRQPPCGSGGEERVGTAGRARNGQSRGVVRRRREQVSPPSLRAGDGRGEGHSGAEDRNREDPEGPARSGDRRGQNREPLPGRAGKASREAEADGGGGGPEARLSPETGAGEAAQRDLLPAAGTGGPEGRGGRQGAEAEPGTGHEGRRSDHLGTGGAAQAPVGAGTG